MKKILIVAVVLLTIALIGGIASAHRWGYGGFGGYMMGPGYRGHMMSPGYGGCWGGDQISQLNPEQTKKLDQLRQKYWQETKGIQDKLFSKHQELQGLYAQPNPDQKSIDKIQKEVFDLQQRLREKSFVFSREAEKIAPQKSSCHGPRRGWHQRGPRCGGGNEEY